MLNTGWERRPSNNSGKTIRPFNIGAMHRAVSHFESCLSDMHRAINCFRRLRRHKEIGRLSDVLNDEKPQFARDKVFDQIRTLRDSIIHLEEMVLDGRLPQGTPFALKADGPETPHPAEPGQTIKRSTGSLLADMKCYSPTWQSGLARWGVWPRK
ncbi:MAG: hypothetical protein WDO56_00185 [Gammaproteobacteria bacterium]